MDKGRQAGGRAGAGEDCDTASASGIAEGCGGFQIECEQTGRRMERCLWKSVAKGPDRLGLSKAAELIADGALGLRGEKAQRVGPQQTCDRVTQSHRSKWKFRLKIKVVVHEAEEGGYWGGVQSYQAERPRAKPSRSCSRHTTQRSRVACRPISAHRRQAPRIELSRSLCEAAFRQGVREDRRAGMDGICCEFSRSSANRRSATGWRLRRNAATTQATGSRL
jgi:hypothetical protein